MEPPLIHLLIEIALSGDEFAGERELDFRDQLTEAVESRGIGEIGGFGSGVGGMDVSVLVRDEQIGRASLAALIRDLAPSAVFTIETLPNED